MAMLASFVQDFVGSTNNSSIDNNSDAKISSYSTTTSSNSKNSTTSSPPPVSTSSGATTTNTTTICVTGLPFKANANEIKEHFKVCGDILSIENKFGYEATEKFKGVCFVKFNNYKETERGLKLDGSTLGGRWIKVRKGLPRGKKDAVGSTRIMVGNLPYEPMPTEEQVGALFKKAGKVISVKFATDGDRKEGDFRGFCFVIFQGQVNAREATKLHRVEFQGRKISVKVIGNPDANKHRKTLPPKPNIEDALFAAYQERRKAQETAAAAASG